MINKSKDWTDDEVIYLREHYSATPIREISTVLNRGWKAIHHKAARLGLGKIKLPSAKELEHIYTSERATAMELCRRFGVSRAAVRLKLTRNGFKMRSKEEVEELSANHCTLSQPLVDFINGLLLGDGCIILNRHGKSGVYSHADKHKEYIEWLIIQFKELGIECGRIYQNRWTGCWAVHTKYYREFVQFRQQWYPNGKKIIPNSLELKPIVLRNWYVGDGHRTEGDIVGAGHKVMLCTYFSKEACARVMQKLAETGIETSHYKRNGIYIKSRSRLKFFNYMFSEDNNIPECYQYKFMEAESLAQCF